jgi:ribose transport system ATP-binding protein
VPPVLELRGVSKAYPGVRALSGVDLVVAPGEAHALLGENGAGKSTLLKILAGTVVADAGEVLVEGARVRIGTPRAARAAGIALIHQELQLVADMTVAQNMFLGALLTRARVFNDAAAMNRRAAAALAELGADIDPRRRVRELSVAQRQLTEIARALLWEARVVAMDEPTSSLTPREFDRLRAVIDRLRARGVGVIYVSHKLDEVFATCARATVLRDGTLVGAVDLAETSHDRLVTMMVGRALERADHVNQARAEVALEVSGLCWGGPAGAVRVDDVGFSVRRGEILGIAGLVGAGRTELLRLIAGVAAPRRGRIVVAGRARAFTSPRQAIHAGIGLVPEERKREGIVPLRSVLANVALPTLGRHSRAGLVRWGRLRQRVTRIARAVALRPPDIDRPIMLFSGGNQQKAIIARWLHADMGVILFDEPTRGVDVGARQEVYRLIEQLAGEGRAIVVVSSDLPEILRLSDRVLVLRQGRVAAMLDRAELSEAAILAHAVPGFRAAA